MKRVIKQFFTNKAVLDASHSIADAVHDVSPRMYKFLKARAVTRHTVYKELIEGDSRPIGETWHGEVIEKVYDK